MKMQRCVFTVRLNYGAMSTSGSSSEGVAASHRGPFPPGTNGIQTAKCGVGWYTSTTKAVLEDRAANKGVRRMANALPKPTAGQVF